MILVDSSVWIDYFRQRRTPHAQKLDTLLGSASLATGDLVLAEVLQGFNESQAFEKAVASMTSLTIVRLGGRDLAIQAARNFQELRRLGITVRKTIDTIIATRCIESGYTLLHDDRDFDPFVKHLGLRSLM